MNYRESLSCRAKTAMHVLKMHGNDNHLLDFVRELEALALSALEGKKVGGHDKTPRECQKP